MCLCISRGWRDHVDKRIVITVNMAWNLANFRSGLIQALQRSGYKVIALAPADAHVSRLNVLGCEFVHIPMDNKGTNPIRDLFLLARYFRVLRRLRPFALLGFTIKPNVYGSIAANIIGIPVINNIAGLGTTFLRGGWLNKVARTLYGVALARSRKVFFQNPEDRDLFVSLGLVKTGQTELLPGSGVDVERFSPSAPRSIVGRPFRFLLVARLLWDKGVGEYVAAVRLLRENGYQIDAQLLGFVDSNNPSAISREQVQAWENEGVVNYLGVADDVRPFLDEADCVVLPSYREGAPRALLEAACMAKPVITTDAPGCRNVMIPEQTGFMVPVRDAQALFDAMKRMIVLPECDRFAMGSAGRDFVMANYDERLVLSAYVRALEELSR